MLRELALRLAFATMAGVIVGVIDLWVFELSWRGFFAGLAAGVAYFIVIALLYVRGMHRFPLVLFGLAIIAGSIGGTAWWLVSRGSALWVAITVGCVLAVMHFAGDWLSQRA